MDFDPEWPTIDVKEVMLQGRCSRWWNKCKPEDLAVFAKEAGLNEVADLGTISKFTAEGETKKKTTVKRLNWVLEDIAKYLRQEVFTAVSNQDKQKPKEEQDPKYVWKQKPMDGFMTLVATHHRSTFFWFGQRHGCPWCEVQFDPNTCSDVGGHRKGSTAVCVLPERIEGLQKRSRQC
jgi:hypothetical protein